ncbi:MAG: ATP-binding protein [Candidatus Zixiibacteriota bacterium]
MPQLRRSLSLGLDQRFTATIVVIVALAVFILTWTGIRQSRTDSFELLVLQGKAFTESLAKAAQNAISSETFYDYLIHLRYTEIAGNVADTRLADLDDAELAQLARRYGLYGLFVYAVDSTPVASSIAAGPRVALPEFVQEEIRQLIGSPESHYVLLLEEGEHPGEAIHYYLEITNTLDRVILIMADALYYVDALQQTQIGYLAQDMARERGVVYIIYQSTEGIIFSSRATGPLLAIESDPFLTDALESDSITHRVYAFQGDNVLELVRPFATTQYPFGLLRVGLSLDGFYAVSRGFDRQMIALAAVLFVLSVVALLYLNSRQRRREIARQYSEMKSVTDKIFDEMRTGVAAVDAAGSITLANAAFENTLGVSGCIGRRWDDVVTLPELSLERITPSRHLTLETEVTVTVDGAEKTLLVAASKFHTDMYQAGGIVVVIYDITRLKEYEHTSARRERLSEMGNLAAGVAHEIRNPLNAISIAAQRLAAECAAGENADEFLAMTEQIRSETKRLDTIITRFLALAREEQERYESINLADFLHRMTDFFTPEATRLQIELSLQVEPDLSITADPDSLKQVFVNLFNNSKEALAGRAGRIEIAAGRRQDSIVISFADSGPGIRPEFREKVFTPYFSTKKAGTGLGLPTVHRIVTKLGGDIRIEQSELGGAKFVMSLPA